MCFVFLFVCFILMGSRVPKLTTPYEALPGCGHDDIAVFTSETFGKPREIKLASKKKISVASVNQVKQNPGFYIKP